MQTLSIADKPEEFRNAVGSNHAPVGMPSLLTSDLTVRGTIASAGDIQLDGELLGSVHCNALTVSPTGKVQGDITAVKASIAGHVTGNLHANEVCFKETAYVDGDIHHRLISVNLGAQLVGQLRRVSSTSLLARGIIEKSDIAAR